MSFILIILFAKLNNMNSSLMSISEASSVWGISTRRIQRLCVEGRIDGAERVGKAWVIPRDSDKPADNRFSDGSKTKTSLLTVVKRVVRRYSQHYARGDANGTVYQTMAWFASVLLRFYDRSNPYASQCREIDWIESEIMRVCPGYNRINAVELDNELIRDLRFLDAHAVDLTDSISWAYQYLRKTNPCNLSSTQFFTERYMVSSLARSNNCEEGVVLDPACGSGNFLIYVMEERYRDMDFRDDVDLKSQLSTISDSLYGYDIDPFLSILASLNLRICGARLLSESGQTPDIQTIMNINTNIYTTCGHSIGGFLDCDRGVYVRKVTDGSKMSLLYMVRSADTILTNPPFKTVKGMEVELKDYLKETIPDSRCDLCVAFLLKIVQCTREGTRCGIVLQNSWMFLESFTDVRRKIFSQARFNSLIILGSGAFANISGEKACVSLASFVTGPSTETTVNVSDLTAKARSEKEIILLEGKPLSTPVLQSSLESGRLSGKNVISLSYGGEVVPYSNFAIPMQGTSTGDSKKLVAYFWEHCGDPSWRLVSKGGGYSRWTGLNRYMVHWGDSGEFIRATPGSAIRNADYFDSTDLVFSDTGTSGLNVRVLEPGQIFIASGPGIRIIEGDPYAHLGFLNSIYATFHIRQLTPKLTIAAGYIGRIPVCKEVVNSGEVADLARQCYDLKKKILSRRPDNYEFEAPDFGLTIDDLAIHMFVADTVDEYEKILKESQLNKIIYSLMGISGGDIKLIEKELGLNDVESEDVCYHHSYLDSKIVSIIDDSCTLKRAKPTRNTFGCDGVLEYLCRESALRPDIIREEICRDPRAFPLTLAKYRNLAAHAIVMGRLGYSPSSTISEVNLDSSLQLGSSGLQSEILGWVRADFNNTHESLFHGHPPFVYSEQSDSIVSRGKA